MKNKLRMPTPIEIHAIAERLAQAEEYRGCADFEALVEHLGSQSGFCVPNFTSGGPGFCGRVIVLAEEQRLGSVTLGLQGVRPDGAYTDVLLDMPVDRKAGGATEAGKIISVDFPAREEVLALVPQWREVLPDLNAIESDATLADHLLSQGVARVNADVPVWCLVFDGGPECLTFLRKSAGQWVDCSLGLPKQTVVHPPMRRAAAG